MHTAAPVRGRRMAGAGVAAPALAFLLLAALYLAAAHIFHATFLHNWTWSELFLHYEGGLVKRGLLGQVAYLVDPLLSARHFLTLVVLCAYLACSAILVFELRLAATLAGLLLLFSPGGLLFPIYDRHAFGRKDVFVFLALALSVLLIRRVRDKRWCFGWILATYTVAGLVVEIAWFYFPLALALYLHHREPEAGPRRLALAAGAALYAGAWLALSYVMSQGASAEAAVRSWLVRYPDAVPDVLRLAHCCLGFKLSDALFHGIAVARNEALRTSYLIAAGLSAVPLAVLVLERETGLGRASGLIRLLLLAGLAGTLAPLVLAADWGRYISLAGLSLFVTLRAMRPAGEPGLQARRVPLVAAIVLVTFYALTWRMLHFQLPDQSALQPGPLLELSQRLRSH